VLDAHIPVIGLGHVLLRTLVDQAVFSPVGLAVFFTYMTITEGGGQKALHRKFTEVCVLEFH
jgi:protein Mpv17